MNWFLSCLSTTGSFTVEHRHWRSISQNWLGDSISSVHQIVGAKGSWPFRPNKDRPLWPPFPGLCSLPVRAFCSFYRGQIRVLLILCLIPVSDKKENKYLNSKDKCSLCISNRNQMLRAQEEDPSMAKESGRLNSLSEYSMQEQLLLATVWHLQEGF